jgi:hypothetical protein
MKWSRTILTGLVQHIRELGQYGGSKRQLVFGRVLADPSS